MGKIGVFDSGFGGLTVLKEIVKRLPQYDYLYLGDNARAPYGSKSRELIYDYTRQAVDYLFAHECELIVLACNTASAEALRKIQQEHLPQKHPGKRVLGVIIPTVEKLVEDGVSERVGIIATEGTVQSGTYVAEINKLAPAIKVFQNPAPLLVPLIESGETSGPDLEKHIISYLGPLLESNIDSLILGCTHYAIIESEIEKCLPSGIRVYNQSSVVAEKLAIYLERHPEIATKLSQDGTCEYLSTDPAGKFKDLGERFYGSTIDVGKITL